MYFILSLSPDSLIIQEMGIYWALSTPLGNEGLITCGKMCSPCLKALKRLFKETDERHHAQTL